MITFISFSPDRDNPIALPTTGARRIRRIERHLRGDQKSQSQAKDRGAGATAQSVLADSAPKQVERGEQDEAAGDGGRAGQARPYEGKAEAVSDAELITETLAGNHDAFEALIRRCTPRVFSIIGSFFRRRDMVEDIAQDVFSRAYFSLSSFTLGRSFEAWVAKIAVNACYDQLRAQRRRGEYQMPVATEREDEWLELQMLEAARDCHLGAERQREAIEISERLLARLDPEDRLVLVLIDRDGYSVKEVSDMTGWGQSKVKVRAFRARRTLRAAMKRLLMSAERKQRTSNE